jgi:tRNA(Glu) U13 pseudouridine synthase TruD
LILWEKILKNELEAQFKVQAYASWLFNKYVDLRIEKGMFNRIIKWDILTPVIKDKKDIFKLVYKNFNSGVQWYNNLTLNLNWTALLKNLKEKFWRKIEEFITNLRVPTWPVYWYNLVVSGDFVEKDWVITKFTEITPALELELEILKTEWFTINVLSNFKKFKVFGIRRAIKVIPQDLRFKWDKNWDLLLMFELPSWSYASVLVEWLDKNVWQKIKI